MTTPAEMISKIKARSLEQFSDAFRTALALGDIEQWSSMLGLSETSDSIKTTYPIPVDAAGYVEFKGDMRYRSLFLRSLSVKPRTWQDGISELAKTIEQDDFAGWGQAPAAMAFEAQRLSNTLVAEQLELNPLIDLYKDEESGDASTIHMFEASGGANPHPYNVFNVGLGSFYNATTAAAIDKTMMVVEKQAFREIKGANGKPLGLRMTHLMVPAAREEEAKEFLEQDMLVQVIQESGANVAAVTQNNRHKGTVQLIVCDELTDDDDVYSLALNKPGMHPWVVQTTGAPEELVLDKSSEYYVRTLKVSLAYILYAAASLAMPHCIRRVTLS